MKTEITENQALELVNAIIGHMYFTDGSPDPDKSWSPDTINNIAISLEKYGLADAVTAIYEDGRDYEVGQTLDVEEIRALYDVEGMDEWEGKDITREFNAHVSRIQIEYLEDSVWRVISVND